ncbi:MAG: hypothetical protein ACI9R3_000576 [Verrucomicrobiales bacterium]|jgi:hypothetical protein
MKIGIVFLVLAGVMLTTALYLASDTRANIAPAPKKDSRRSNFGDKGDFRGAEKVDSSSAGEATTKEDISRQLKELINGETGKGPTGLSIEDAMANQTFTLTPLQKQVRDAPAIGRIKTVQADEGFVVLDSGLDQNLQSGMNLAVRRQYYIVAKLIVGETIDTSESVANIAPNTIPTGITLREGDAVIPWADIVALKDK